MKFPGQIYLKWDRQGPRIVGPESIKQVSLDEPDLIGVYQLIQEVKEQAPPGKKPAKKG